MRAPTAEQWHEYCKEIRDLADALDRDGMELIRRAQHGTRDGYPTSSMGFVGGSSKGGHSDPVLDLVQQRQEHPDSDPIRSNAAKMHRFLMGGRNELRAAVSQMECAKNPKPGKGEISRESSVCICVNCATTVANTPADRFKSGRCDTCYRYRLRHDGQDRVVTMSPDTEKAS